MPIQRIIPCLWFDGQAERAAEFYTSIFPNSRVVDVAHYGEAGREVHGQKAGTAMLVVFELNGQRFQGLNGGPDFKFNEAVSLVIECDSQDEIDHYWNRLTEGGDPKAQVCGWLKDKFGLSWQVVPRIIGELISDSDRAKADRVMNAVLQMKKIDIATLERAAEDANS